MSSPSGHVSPSHLSTEEEELILVRRLVDECYTSHRRAFFGALPPEQCKLCSYTNGESADKGVWQELNAGVFEMSCSVEGLIMVV